MKINELLEIMKWRNSCRSYDASKEISDEAINNCIIAANNAPSACNKQPWRFVIVKDPQTLKDLYQYGILPGLPMKWIPDAPVIAVLCAKSDAIVHWFTPLFSKIPYYLVDSGIAGEHFVLAAAAQGIGTCWIGWINGKAIRRVLGIPRGIQPIAIQPIAMFTMGYPLEKRNPAPKLDQSEIAFFDKWGKSRN